MYPIYMGGIVYNRKISKADEPEIILDLICFTTYNLKTLYT